MRRFLLATAALAATLTAPAANAQLLGTATVDAQANSTTGGTGFATGVLLIAGRSYRLTQDPNDLWSSGPLPRFSDGNGIVPRTADGDDDSGQPVGTQIGGTFDDYTQGNLTARYGSVVAVLGGNTFQFLGSGQNFVAQQSGLLSLGYFDSNFEDNAGAITFGILAVPEPATWALMLLGFGAIGATMRRRAKVRVAYA